MVADLITRTDAQAFHAAMTGARAGSRGAYLTLYSVGEYERMRAFTAEHGRVGGALKDHGDGRIEIVSLFNDGGPPGAGLRMMGTLIGEGGNYCEAFGDRLKNLYGTVGFRVSNSFEFDPSLVAPDWNYVRDGRPLYYTLVTDQCRV